MRRQQRLISNFRRSAATPSGSAASSLNSTMSKRRRTIPTHPLHEPAERALAFRRHATQETAEAMDNGPAPHPLVALQRHVGNAEVARMLAQREGEEEEE